MIRVCIEEEQCLSYITQDVPSATKKETTNTTQKHKTSNANVDTSYKHNTNMSQDKK